MVRGDIELNTAEQYLNTAYATSRRDAGDAEDPQQYAKGVADSWSQVIASTEDFALGSIRQALDEDDSLYFSETEKDVTVARARSAAAVVIQQGGTNQQALEAASRSIEDSILEKTYVADKIIAERLAAERVLTKLTGSGSTGSRNPEE